MGRIRDIIKRISLTHWLLFAVVVLLFLILAELSTINETLEENRIWTQLKGR